MSTLHFCCICGNHLPVVQAESDSKSEKPTQNRSLLCCPRIICAECTSSNPRFETYCPFCQSIRLPRIVTSAGASHQPPPYKPTEPGSFLAEAQSPSSPGTEQRNGHDAIIRSPLRTPPPSYDIANRQTPHIMPTISHPFPPLDYAGSEVAGDVTHHLSPDDSLLSISLAYHVPLPSLRAHNRLHSDHLLSARRILKIPHSHYHGPSLSPRPVEGEGESKRKAKIRRFMVRSKCVEYKVAVLYLESCGWSLDDAVERWIEDEMWEREHPLKYKANGAGGSEARLRRSKPSF